MSMLVITRWYIYQIFRLVINQRSYRSGDPTLYMNWVNPTSQSHLDGPPIWWLSPSMVLLLSAFRSSLEESIGKNNVINIIHVENMLVFKHVISQHVRVQYHKHMFRNHQLDRTHHLPLFLQVFLEVATSPTSPTLTLQDTSPHPWVWSSVTCPTAWLPSPRWIWDIYLGWDVGMINIRCNYHPIMTWWWLEHWFNMG